MKSAFAVNQIVKTKNYLPPIVSGSQVKVMQIVNKGTFLRYQVQTIELPEQTAWAYEDDLEPPLFG